MKRSAFTYYMCLIMILFPILAAALTCPPNNPNRALNELKDYLIPVAIIGKEDGRKPISQVCKKQGLSDEECKQSLTSTGMIRCPGSEHGNGANATAAITGATDRLVTVAHIFYDESGTPRTPFEECFFANYSHPDIHYPISIEPNDFALGSMGQAVRKTLGDYAVVRLKNPVMEAKPYKVDLSQSAASKGDRLIVISNTYKFNWLGHEPNIQACSVTHAYSVDNMNRNGYLTDCDTEKGDSGGINLVRISDGSLAIKGLNTSEVKNSVDHCTYDDKTCSSASVELSGPFLESLLNSIKSHQIPSAAAKPSQDETSNFSPVDIQSLKR